jgi:hypothetical protein
MCIGKGVLKYSKNGLLIMRRLATSEIGCGESSSFLIDRPLTFEQA